MWGPISRRRGFNLIEVVVSSTVMLGMLGILYLLALAGLRLFEQSKSYQGGQQEVQKALARLGRDLNNSCREHLVVSAGAVRFLSPERLAPQSGFEYALDSARLRWWKWLCYSLDPGSELVRSEVALSGGPRVDLLPGPGPAPALTVFRSQAYPARKTLARNIEQWSITQGSRPGCYRVRVVALEPINSRSRTRIEVETQVTVLNR